MKRTISFMTGKGSVNHNSRKFHAKNIDSERSYLNVEYCNEDVKDVYHELFDEALVRYNEKQTRSDRKIDDYYDKICFGKQEKPFHEIILQIGDKDNMGATTENGQLAAKVLDEYMRDFQRRNPTLRVFSAYLHMDEATPHLHIDFVPYTTGSKRGLDTRVSLKQALSALGFKGGTRSETELNQWVQHEKKQLAEIMLERGIEWEQKGTHEKHLSVLDFKKKERAKEVAARYEKKLVEIAPMVKDMERFAVKYSYDPEEVLPEAGTLESGKTYREKKAKPLIEKIITVLRSVYRAYLDISRNYNDLQRSCERAWNKVNALSQYVEKLRDENIEMKEKLKDVQYLYRVMGKEKVNKIIQQGKEAETIDKMKRQAQRRTQWER